MIVCVSVCVKKVNEEFTRGHRAILITPCRRNSHRVHTVTWHMIGAEEKSGIGQ